MSRQRHRFPRAERLRSRRDFERLTRTGSRERARNLLLLRASPRPDAKDDVPCRLGLTVSRKVGNAVVRNRVKRRLREWFRQGGREALGVCDAVIIARPGAAMWTQAALTEELASLLAHESRRR